MAPRTSLGLTYRLRGLPLGADMVWGFLLFTGYLTATRLRQRDELQAAEASPVRKIGVVFEGKKVKVAVAKR